MRNPTNLGSLLPDLKNTLTRVNKSRSRYVSSSGEDQSPAARHRSSKPSRAEPSGAVSDQDLPQHDPDPPYYREIALSDMPSQYAEEVDTGVFFHSLTPGSLCLGLQLQCWVWTSVRNSLQSSGGPIGPQGSEVQWPLLKLDGPNFLKTN